MKILFAVGPSDGTPAEGALFWKKIKDKLEKENYHILFHSFFKESVLTLKKLQEECVYIPKELDNYKEIDRYSKVQIQKALEEIELKYNCSTERILLGDFDYNHSVPRKKAFIDMIKYFRIFEKYFQKQKPDVVIGGGQRYFNLIPFFICKKINIKYINVHLDIFPGEFTITDNIFDESSEFKAYWNEVKEKEISEEERLEIQDYFDSITKKFQKPTWASIDQRPKVNKKKIAYLFNRIYTYLFVEDKKTPYLRVFRGVKKYFMKILRSKIVRIIYSKPDYNSKYIFYPLHVEWDDTIIVNNPQFIEQENLIKQISQSLPAGHQLYVKEHPANIGGIPISILRKIKRLPNVKLLPSEEDSYKIIKNCQAVITIVGSSGWEALLFEKPLIVLGNAYYKSAGVTWNVENLADIPVVMRRALQEKKNDKEKFLRFVSAYKKFSYKGLVAFSGLYYSTRSNSEEVLADENIKSVSESLINYFSKY
ncbi:MAG: hypothetical protein ABIC91_06030 [Nanoarchaeota archaeon]|nr:hypothetical protein [Nanoarchaeota archaeon]MBU1849704.1 hypothetical protein [Nanoarchaeota archaeon]